MASLEALWETVKTGREGKLKNCLWKEKLRSFASKFVTWLIYFEMGLFDGGES